MEKDKKVGRPRKDVKEKGIRTSSMLNPIYRKIIDDLCQSRECSISEAIELCVHQYAVKEKLIDEYFEKDFEIKLFQSAIVPVEEAERLYKVTRTMQKIMSNWTHDDFEKLESATEESPFEFPIPYDENEFTEVNKTNYRKDLNIATLEFTYKISTAPKAQENYLMEVFKLIGVVVTYFDTEKLISAIIEQWKKGISSKQCAENAIAAVHQYKQEYKQENNE